MAKTKKKKATVKEEQADIETPEEAKEEFNVYRFLDIQEEDDAEAVAKKVEAKIGITMQTMQESLSKWTIDHAEELTLELPNIAPLGDYSKLLECNDDMAEFLKTEGHKTEHWKLMSIAVSDLNKELLSFSFANMGVDTGETMKGFVFTNKTGTIRHSFAQVEE